MIKNCGQKIVDCVTDKTCKAGLDCLEGCAFNDQVGGWGFRVQGCSWGSTRYASAWRPVPSNARQLRTWLMYCCARVLLFQVGTGTS